jgi:hypothetical protein
LRSGDSVVNLTEKRKKTSQIREETEETVHENSINFPACWWCNEFPEFTACRLESIAKNTKGKKSYEIKMFARTLKSAADFN